MPSDGAFALRSGPVSNEYFDRYLLEADPPLLRRVAGPMAGLVPAGTGLLIQRAGPRSWSKT